MMSHLPDLKGLTILIADNDRRSVRELERSLREFVADVFTADTSGDALTALRFRQIQVIVASADLVEESFVKAVGASEVLKKRLAELGSLRKYRGQEEITEEMLEILGSGMFFAS